MTLSPRLVRLAWTLPAGYAFTWAFAALAMAAGCAAGLPVHDAEAAALMAAWGVFLVVFLAAFAAVRAARAAAWLAGGTAGMAAAAAALQQALLA